MWADHEVRVRRPVVKRFVHPVAGPLEFDCQVLDIRDTDQRLVLYAAAPSSPTWAAFRRLAADGGMPVPLARPAPARPAAAR
jgi:hypothetical protein